MWRSISSWELTLWMSSICEKRNMVDASFCGPTLLGHMSAKRQNARHVFDSGHWAFFTTGVSPEDFSGRPLGKPVVERCVHRQMTLSFLGPTMIGFHRCPLGHRRGANNKRHHTKKSIEERGVLHICCRRASEVGIVAKATQLRPPARRSLGPKYLR